MTTNNVPELIKQYGGKMTFMGDIDSGKVDHPAWSRDEIRKYTEIACKECGKLYFIPCLWASAHSRAFMKLPVKLSTNSVKKCFKTKSHLQTIKQIALFRWNPMRFQG